MNRQKIANLERRVAAAQETLTPDDYRLGLRFHATTGHLPDSIETPRLADRTFQVRAFKALANTGVGTGTLDDIKKPPKDAEIPKELTAYAKMKAMGPYPGDFDSFDQGIFLNLYRKAHGALGDLARWAWAGLRPSIVHEFWKQDDPLRVDPQFGGN
jgi:hypothetical protein